MREIGKEEGYFILSFVIEVVDIIFALHELYIEFQNLFSGLIANNYINRAL